MTMTFTPASVNTEEYARQLDEILTLVRSAPLERDRVNPQPLIQARGRLGALLDENDGAELVDIAAAYAYVDAYLEGRGYLTFLGFAENAIAREQARQ